MSDSDEQGGVAARAPRRFQFGLRQLLGFVAFVCLAAAIVGWRDARMSYVPEAFAALALGISVWAVLTRRWYTCLFGVLLFTLLLIRTWLNGPSEEIEERPRLGSATEIERRYIEVQVLDSRSRPVADAQVRVESKIGSRSTVRVGRTNDDGLVRIDSFYSVTVVRTVMSDPPDRYQVDPGGSARIDVSAQGFVGRSVSISLPSNNLITVAIQND